MAEFYLYADESGKFHNADHISFCGYLTHGREWGRICVEWNDCRMAYDVPPVHMASIMYPERDKEWLRMREKWGKDWEARRNEMLKELASVVMNSHAVCIGASVDARHFKTMDESPFKREVKDPIFMAFYMVIRNALDILDRNVRESPSLALVFDDDRQFAKETYEFVDQLREAFPRVNKIDSICFANDKAYPGVQMADMVAYESRSLLIQRMENPKIEPSMLFFALTRKLLHQPLILTSEHLDTLAANWGKP
jgi:Protein of unknown function (DUF3800)